MKENNTLSTNEMITSELSKLAVYKHQFCGSHLQKQTLKVLKISHSWRLLASSVQERFKSEKIKV